MNLFSEWSCRFCDAGDEKAIFKMRRGEDGVSYSGVIEDLSDQIDSDVSLSDHYASDAGSRALVAETYRGEVLGLAMIEIGTPTTVETWAMPDHPNPWIAADVAEDALVYLGACGVETADVTVHLRGYTAEPPGGGDAVTHAARTLSWPGMKCGHHSLRTFLAR